MTTKTCVVCEKELYKFSDVVTLNSGFSNRIRVFYHLHCYEIKQEEDRKKNEIIKEWIEAEINHKTQETRECLCPFKEGTCKTTQCLGWNKSHAKCWFVLFIVREWEQKYW
jgi:3-deoxy-D-arabino-heptulosonate 7-phosphate (DAHP) synthase